MRRYGRAFRNLALVCFVLLLALVCAASLYLFVFVWPQP